MVQLSCTASTSRSARYRSTVRSRWESGIDHRRVRHQPVGRRTFLRPREDRRQMLTQLLDPSLTRPSNHGSRAVENLIRFTTRNFAPIRREWLEPDRTAHARTASWTRLQKTHIRSCNVGRTSCADVTYDLPTGLHQSFRSYSSRASSPPLHVVLNHSTVSDET